MLPLFFSEHFALSEHLGAILSCICLTLWKFLMADNQRNDYRHSFRSFDRISVELLIPGSNRPVVGEVLDLSLGGMKVRIKGRNLPLYNRDPITARSNIPGINSPSGLNALVVYCQTTREGQVVGLHFVGTSDPAVNEDREKTMWLYLLDQQRAQRRRLMLQPDFVATPQ
jgi:hypothetical protein